ncbi:MAG TPA: hypothetical protein VK190_03470 [Pseudoneobacillus sp.]|nr:hypothetical protein [Pseudoneobacillus sp.]
MTRLEIEMLMAADEFKEGIILRYESAFTKDERLFELKFFNRYKDGTFSFAGRPISKEKGYYETMNNSWAIADEKQIIRIEKI